MTAGSMARPHTPAWPQFYARTAGALYLIVIVGGTFAELFVRARLVVPGDPATTAHNIHTHELLYRLGFVVELLYCACNVPLIVILYNLFKVVNKNVALLMVLFAFTANAVECVSLLAHFAPWISRRIRATCTHLPRSNWRPQRTFQSDCSNRASRSVWYFSDSIA